MSKLNPHRKIVLKMSVYSASRLMTCLTFAKKYSHIFEYDTPEYELIAVALRNYVKSAVDNCDGVHQSVVDIELSKTLHLLD